MNKLNNKHQNIQSGAGLVSVITGKAYRNKTKAKKAEDQKPITKAKRSETQLIKNYEELATASKRYYKSFNKHLKNLITLDDLNNMGSALTTTFRNIVVKNELKGKDKINTSNPLLLRNYLVSPNTLPRNFRKEHLLQQVRYKLSQINPKDALLFNMLDVTLEGKTATIKFHAINGDTFERTNKVGDEYELDMPKLLNDIRDIIGSIKKKMDYEIEIVEDFELGDDNIEMPGLQFANDDAGMDAKLRALEMGKSIQANNADVDTISEAAKKAEEREPPARDVVFDLSSERPAYRPRPSEDMMDRPDDIGLDQGFGTDRQLEKKPLDIEADLAAIIEGGPEAAGAGTGSPIHKLGDNRRSKRRSTMKARERRFGSESNSRSRRRSKRSRREASASLDPMERTCRNITDERECKSTIGCHYNKGYQKCHKDVKI